MKKKKKLNKNANSIYENKHKFQMGESYSYKDICTMCNMKEYNGGDSKKKQINILKELFDIEEYKDKSNKNTTMYKFLNIKELSVIEACEIIENKRGSNPNSWGNKKSEYSEAVIDGLLAELFLIGLMVEEIDSESSNVKNDSFKSKYRYIDEDSYAIETSKFELSCWAGIRNANNFKSARLNRIDFCKNLNVNIRSFEYIYPKTNNSIYRATNYILNKLNDTGHVSFRETIEIVVPEFKNEYGHWLEDEEIEENRQKQNYVNVYAEEYDPELVDKIKILRGKVANEMGFKSLSKIYNNSNQSIIDKFNTELENLVKEKYGVIKFYPKVVMYVNKTSIFNYLMMKGYDIEEIKDKCTRTFKSHILDKMIKSIDIIDNPEAIANKLQYAANKHNTKESYFYYDMVQKMNYYKNDLLKITDALIDPGHEDIEVKEDTYKDFKVRYHKKKFTPNEIKNYYGTYYLNNTDDDLIKKLLEL